MHKCYESLELTYPASREEIKKAFYRLARVWHPDKKTGNEKKFKEINNAYQMLMKNNIAPQEERRQRPVWGEMGFSVSFTYGTRRTQQVYDKTTNTWYTVTWR